MPVARRPHIWFEFGRWHVAARRDSVLYFSGLTIPEAWNQRFDYLLQVHGIVALTDAENVWSIG